MKEKFDGPGCPSADKHRSADDIRRDIKTERETITKAVETLGSKLQNALDWRSYVRQAPIISLGAAAGLGVMLSVLLKRRRSPIVRIVDSAARSSQRVNSQSLLSMGVYTLISKLLLDVAKSTASNIAKEGVRAEERDDTNYSDTVH